MLSFSDTLEGDTAASVLPTEGLWRNTTGWIQPIVPVNRWCEEVPFLSEKLAHNF